jgi:hypothetical protein
MATIPSYTTFVAGAVLTAAQLNTNVRDSGNFWLARPIAVLLQTLGQAISNNTWTDIPLDSELIDSDGGHSTVTNTARYTPQTAGWFLFSGGVSFASNATGVRGVRWSFTGTAVNGSQALVNSLSGQVTSTVARTQLIAANGSTDYVTIQGFQTSGGSLNSSAATTEQPDMSVLWIRTN